MDTTETQMWWRRFERRFRLSLRQARQGDFIQRLIRLDKGTKDMANENKIPSFKAMLADGYEGPTTVYYGREQGMDAKMAILAFLNGKRTPIDECRDCYLPIIGWVAKLAEFSQDDGSSRDGLLLGLILEDGCIVQSTSKTIADTLDTLSDLLGPPPYANPVWVQVTEIVTRKKRKTDQLVPVKLAEIPADGKVVTAKGLVERGKQKK